VVTAPFAAPEAVTEEPTAAPSLITRLPQYRQELISVVGLLLAFVLGLQVLKALKSTAARPAPALIAAADGEARALGMGPGASVGNPTASAALARSVDSPEMAARLLRSWMKES
jgi:hypothetical protein